MDEGVLVTRVHTQATHARWVVHYKHLWQNFVFVTTIKLVLKLPGVNSNVRSPSLVYPPSAHPFHPPPPPPHACDDFSRWRSVSANIRYNIKSNTYYALDFQAMLGRAQPEMLHDMLPLFIDNLTIRIAAYYKARETAYGWLTFQLMTFFMPLCSTAMGRSPLS